MPQDCLRRGDSIVIDTSGPAMPGRAVKQLYVLSKSQSRRHAEGWAESRSL